MAKNFVCWLPYTTTVNAAVASTLSPLKSARNIVWGLFNTFFLVKSSEKNFFLGEKPLVKTRYRHNLVKILVRFHNLHILLGCFSSEGRFLHTCFDVKNLINKSVELIN